LFAVAFIDGISKGSNYDSVAGGLSPEGIVVKMFLIALLGGVINILHVNKDGDFFHAVI
jgi:hypothetical protein